MERIPRSCVGVFVVLGSLVGGCADAGRERVLDAGPSVEREVTVQAPRASRVVRQSGSLVQVIDALQVMPAQSRSYEAPTIEQREFARRAFRALRGGALELGAEELAKVEMEVVLLDDVERQYVVVRERVGAPFRGLGVFVLDLRATRPYVIEAPHARNDPRTAELAVRWMVALRAEGLVIGTSFRCATTTLSGCVGRTEACSSRKRGRGPFRLSDMAHTTASVFHVAHRELMAADPSAVAVQLHGFARRPGRRWHVIVSDGTPYRARQQGIANRLARLIKREAQGAKGIVSCNARRRRVPLCGTLSVQGRDTNGSPDPCRRRPRRSTNRFVHIELSSDARTPGGLVDPTAIERSLARLLPAADEVTVPVPDHWPVATPSFRKRAIRASALRAKQPAVLLEAQQGD